MAEKINVPEIRFTGFVDPWEQRKFGELYRPVSEKNDMSFGRDRIISVANMYFNSVVYVTEDSYLATYNVMRLGDIAFEGNRSKYFAHGRFVENTIGDGIVSHVFKVFRPVDNNFDISYWKHAINNEKLMKDVLTRSTKASTMMHELVSSDFLEESTLVPSLDEQRAIGTAIDSIDNLITLHQRERRKAPFSRSFAWEQRKLGDEFAFLKNNTLSRAELSDSEGAVRNIHYGDILTKFGSVLDGAHVGIPRIMNEETARSLTNDQLRDGDIIVADTAEDEAVGKCTELRELGINKIVSGLHTIPLRPYSRYAPGFLGHYLNSDAYHCQLKPLMQGIKVISISRTALAETQLTVPSFDEQRQIGGYFSNLDALITLHQ